MTAEPLSTGPTPYDGVTITQNLMYGNQAGCGGGAIAMNPSTAYGRGLSLIVDNNTIVDNLVQAQLGNTCNGMATTNRNSQIYALLHPPPEGDRPYPGALGPTAIIANNIISGSTSELAFGHENVIFPPTSERVQRVFDHNILHNSGGALFCPLCIDVSSRTLR